MSVSLSDKAIKLSEEGLTVHDMIYEQMERLHRRARMSSKDKIVLDSKLLGTTGTLAAAIIAKGARSGHLDLSLPTNEALIEDALEWIEEIISLHASIYGLMVKNYRHPRIDPDDETLLDTKMFEAAGHIAQALYERSEKDESVTIKR